MTAAGFGVQNNSGGFAFKADPDGNVKIGDEASDVMQVTGSSFFNGEIKSTHYVTAVTTQDLGNTTSNTLSINSGVVLLDADSINGTEMMGQEVHSLVIPNGTSSGQRLSLVVKTTTNNVSIMPSGIISGSFGALNASIGTTALEFVWISEGSHGAWHQL
jgi:hypothetical protein|tara:strand:- start:59 stop:538 length:480 start_codon:yes stop_codon:yes gene_type:complete